MGFSITQILFVKDLEWRLIAAQLQTCSSHISSYFEAISTAINMQKKQFIIHLAVSLINYDVDNQHGVLTEKCFGYMTDSPAPFSKYQPWQLTKN